MAAAAFHVSQQLSAACLHGLDYLDPTGATAAHEAYQGSAAWPAGNGPWYGLGVVPNH